jgi:hypothetical protein
MHHNTALYGEDASNFRPERWLEEKDPEKLAAMIRTNDLIFGYGKWSCLGKSVAHMEIGKLIFEVRLSCPISSFSLFFFFFFFFLQRRRKRVGTRKTRVKWKDKREIKNRKEKKKGREKRRAIEKRGEKKTCGNKY